MGRQHSGGSRELVSGHSKFSHQSHLSSKASGGVLQKFEAMGIGLYQPAAALEFSDLTDIPGLYKTRLTH